MAMTGIPSDGSVDVSIVIPAFNREQTIERAIRSCLSQSCSVEVIVVDDGSSDATCEVVRRVFAGDQRANGRLVCQARAGACAARNRGLDEAKGAFVKFLDSDDELVAGVLAVEVRRARETGADVVASAWEERCWKKGREVVEQRVRVACPMLLRGIDDMLLGQSPWTGAALYRRAFVAPLRWKAEHGKADDWGWAWTVCLAGARYALLEEVTAIYWHHEAERITGQANAFRNSTVVRQQILGMVEHALAHQGGLTPDRRRALVQYYYKDRLVVCERSVEEWRRLWRHCRHLAPGWRPSERHSRVRPFVFAFGVFWGVRIYVRARSRMVAAASFFRRAGLKLVRWRVVPGADAQEKTL
jgi:glycosyltransferase involved in cell wall biosynthesis